MCLLALAWRTDAQHPLVLAANRDEFHARPAAPMQRWQDAPILGGRDLQAGGTWLAFGSGGRFGIVTNFREMTRPRRAAPSRGELVPRFLAGDASAAQYLAALEVDAMAYAGFNLLLGDGESLWYASNRADEFARPLPPGVYGLSNHFLDTPWPKLLRLRDRLQALLPHPDPALELLAALEDRSRAELHDLPATGLTPEWEHVVSAPFVLHPDYGTRCATVALLDAAGSGRVRERRYGSDGQPIGEAEFELNAR